MLEKYTLSFRPLLTDVTFAIFKKRVKDFGKDGGMGEILQQRLKAWSKDPDIKRWLYEH